MQVVFPKLFKLNCNFVSCASYVILSRSVGTSISQKEIQSVHEESHFGPTLGVEKTCFFCEKKTLY